jgi:hypothetical protein
VDPLGLRKLTISFSAFINGDDGQKLSDVFPDFNKMKFRGKKGTQATWNLLAESTWFKSPAPQHSAVASLWPSTARYFRTDSRGKYEPGTSRAKHTVTFDTDDVGKLEGSASVVFENDPTFAVFRYLGSSDGVDGRVMEKKAVFTKTDGDVKLVGPLAGSVKDILPGCHSQIRASASGADPLAFGAPSLDYNFIVSVRKTANGTHVSLIFKHDKFPDYEVLVGDRGKYHFRGDGSFLAGGLELMRTNGFKSIDLGFYE